MNFFFKKDLGFFVEESSKYVLARGSKEPQPSGNFSSSPNGQSGAASRDAM